MKTKQPIFTLLSLIFWSALFAHGTLAQENESKTNLNETLDSISKVIKADQAGSISTIALNQIKGCDVTSEANYTVITKELSLPDGHLFQSYSLSDLNSLNMRIVEYAAFKKYSLIIKTNENKKSIKLEWKVNAPPDYKAPYFVNETGITLGSKDASNRIEKLFKHAIKLCNEQKAAD